MVPIKPALFLHHLVSVVGCHYSFLETVADKLAFQYLSIHHSNFAMFEDIKSFPAPHFFHNPNDNSRHMFDSIANNIDDSMKSN